MVLLLQSTRFIGREAELVEAAARATKSCAKNSDLRVPIRTRRQVWFWDHEREGHVDAATFVAPSLAKFLSLLD